MSLERPLLAIILLVAINAWGIVMWRGDIASDWIKKQARRRSWGSPPSLSFLTTAGPWWAVGSDLIVASSFFEEPLRSTGRDLTGFLLVAPGLMAWTIAYAVGGWDRPRWALPPWFAPGDVTAKRKGTRPITRSQC